MSLFITKRPYITANFIDVVNGNAVVPVDLKWNCVHNEIYYEMQRQDYQVVKVEQGTVSNQYIKVTVNGTIPVPAGGSYSGITPGGMMYVSTPVYKGAYDIYDYTQVGITTIVQLACPWTTDDLAGGFINDHYNVTNYWVEVTIYHYDVLSQQKITAGVMRVTSNTAGFIRADVSTYLKKQMQMVNKNTYTSLLPFLDKYASGKFSIAYREMFTGSTNIPVDDSPNIFFYTNSVKQIQMKYGGNLGENVPLAIQASVPAKFMCDFVEPTYFGPAYPFDIALLNSEYIAGKLLLKRERRYDVSGTALGIFDMNPVPLTLPGEMRLLIQGNYAVTYSQTISKINLWLVVGGIVQQRYVNDTYVDPGYSEVIPPTPSTDPPYIATEEKTIRVCERCYDNPVYLAWKGMQGGWSYWLFHYKQISSLEAKNESIIGVNNVDLELAESVEEVISKSGLETLQVGCDQLDQNDVNGLKKMLMSPKIQVYVGVSNGLRVWKTVKIKNGTFELMDNSTKYHSFKATLDLHDYKTIQQ